MRLSSTCSIRSWSAHTAGKLRATSTRTIALLEAGRHPARRFEHQRKVTPVALQPQDPGLDSREVRAGLYEAPEARRLHSHGS